MCGLGLEAEVLDARNATGRTALHLACSQGNLWLAEALLEAGASANLEIGRGDRGWQTACGP